MMYRVFVQNDVRGKPCFTHSGQVDIMSAAYVVSLPPDEMDVSDEGPLMYLELGAGWSVVTRRSDETGTIWTDHRLKCQSGHSDSVRPAPSEHTLHNNSLVSNKFGQYRN